VLLSQLGDICVQSLLDALVSVVRDLAVVDYEPSEERGAFRWEAVPGNWSGATEWSDIPALRNGDHRGQNRQGRAQGKRSQSASMSAA